MIITPVQALQRVVEHREIFFDEMKSLMTEIMKGEVPDSIVAAILTGLRVKKESLEEIAAAAEVLRELSFKVSPVNDLMEFVDIVGTGGDGAQTFNISTTAFFVVAAAGAQVAKHGNRNVSSCSGSADVLESLGVNIDLSASQVASCLDKLGMGFMFAPNHHPAMKQVASVRKELKIKTIFNILGPLLNPAQAPNTLMGVFHPDLVGIQARVMRRLGAKHVMVVWGKDGMDEISVGASTLVCELKDGNILEYEIHPEDFGLSMSSNRHFQVDSIEQSKKMLLDVLHGQQGPAFDVVVLNAGAALYCSGRVDTIMSGIDLARETILSGKSLEKMKEMVFFTQKLVI